MFPNTVMTGRDMNNLTVGNMTERLEDVTQQVEDLADRVISRIKPHARSLAKLGILFLHIQICFLVLFQFRTVSKHIGQSLKPRVEFNERLK